MRKLFPLMPALAFICVLVPQVAFPQQLTGTLIGTIKDEQEGVLPDAVVRVSSRALISGSLTTVTNGRGQLRFQGLPPGPYQLEINLQGFSPYREEDIAIGAGATIDRTVILTLAGVAQAIVVEASGSRVEARNSGFETRFGAAYLRTIPGRRFSMFDFIKAAPGISPTSPSSGTSNSVSAFGSGVNENAFLLDGTNFTCPCSGGAVAEPGIDVHRGGAGSVGGRVCRIRQHAGRCDQHRH